jgi:ribonuclease D
MQKEILVFENDMPEKYIDLTKNIAVDTEAMGLDLNRDKLCLVQLFYENDDKVFLIKINDKNVAPNLKKLLTNKKTVKIFHYGRFDIAMIKKYLNIETNNIFCTKIASRLVRTYTDAHSLKELCKELLSVTLQKGYGSSNWSEKELSEEQKSYAANDVIYLHDIKDKLSVMLADFKRKNLANSLFKALIARVDADLNGWSNVDLFAHFIPRNK